MGGFLRGVRSGTRTRLSQDHQNEYDNPLLHAPKLLVHQPLNLAISGACKDGHLQPFATPSAQGWIAHHNLGTPKPSPLTPQRFDAFRDDPIPELSKRPLSIL
eukprot:1737936-Amphidinium_carterae.1